MKTFPIREIAKEFAHKFGGTDGNEEKAYLEGAKAALDYAMSLCISGSTVSMIRFVLHRKREEADGKENP